MRRRLVILLVGLFPDEPCNLDFLDTLLEGRLHYLVAYELARLQQLFELRNVLVDIDACLLGVLAQGRHCARGRLRELLGIARNLWQRDRLLEESPGRVLGRREV